MSFSARARYLLVTAAISVASLIQLARGYRAVVVVTGWVAFLFFGNLAVWLSGTQERRRQRQRKRDYYAGKI